jgi:hypothetical protein
VVCPRSCHIVLDCQWAELQLVLVNDVLQEISVKGNNTASYEKVILSLNNPSAHRKAVPRSMLLAYAFETLKNSLLRRRTLNKGYTIR